VCGRESGGGIEGSYSFWKLRKQDFEGLVVVLMAVVAVNFFSAPVSPDGFKV